ncbi:MAG: alcohol dehydrogenase [Deltaproteobacteria bacterium]|jgi:S-(hydroxymethyl)glutathione dehydrogenase/alcohol dehydrogenase|nr:alcohol dehydrogenase [Deltaproteobacteria bacterium]
MKAAVMRQTNAPLEIEDLDIDKPGPGEVLVRTVASGICHSDLHVLEGNIPVPPPCILGHEPAGIVEMVGEGVTDFAEGDHVIGCISAWCGACPACLAGKPHLCANQFTLTMRPGDAPPRISRDGDPVLQFANLSSFAEKMLCHERGLVKIRPDMPLDQAALIGCGVTTGLGAALNTARVEPGSTCAIIGLGGVGLAALQGCRIAGAGRIIAIDTQSFKLDLARKMGATDVVNGADGDPVAQVVELTGGGVDYAFECIGLGVTVQQAVGMAKAGGAAVLVGVVPVGEMVELPISFVTLQEKRLLGSMMGSNRFRVDMPRYVEYYLDGRLQLDEMISDRIGLEGVNDAFEKLRKGEAARQVIHFDS